MGGKRGATWCRSEEVIVGELHGVGVRRSLWGATWCRSEEVIVGSYMV